MNRQEMNLNIRYDAPASVWDKMPIIYKQLDGSLETTGGPTWFGVDENEKHIWASIEPAGLHFVALMDDEEWEAWVKNIKRIATEVLGFKVGEIELGEVDY